MKLRYIIGGLLAGYVIMRMTNAQDFLARTLWAEARGEGREGMIAVANVVMNRVKSARYPDSVVGVVFQEWQFSAWNPGDPNRRKALTVTEDDKLFQLALSIAGEAVHGTLPDITGGAMHYHVIGLNPNWRDDSKISATIGHHVFYAGIA